MEAQGQQWESVWTVARAWLSWCLTLVFAITLGWSTFAWWVEATQFSHSTRSQLAIATVNKSSPAIPLIVALSIMAVTLADVLGGGILVTKRFLEEKFLNPWLEKRKAEARAEAERADRVNRHWRAWNQRRLKAEANGEPFNEPPPDMDTIGEGP
jgi:TRAP-type C4-dicarboxylate transport system permease small subunit